jgi:hypothetical protein
MKEIKNLATVPLFLFVSFFFFSCSKNLSRDMATSLIDNHPEFLKIGVTPHANSHAIIDGFDQGFWDQNGNLMNKGYEIFSEGLRYGILHLKIPIKLNVAEVTGISDAVSPLGGEQNNLKEVQFRWEYSDIEGATKRFVSRGGTGVALLRLFDDGWRVEKVETQNIIDDGFVLTSKEQQAADKDRELERNRRIDEDNRIAEANRVAKAAEEERIMKIVERFKDNGNGTLTDSKTGLTWMKKSISDQTWQQGISICQNLGTGWHMASREELETIIAENGNSFIDTPDGSIFKETLNTRRGGFRVSNSVDNNYSLYWGVYSPMKDGWKNYGKWNSDASCLCVKKGR